MTFPATLSIFNYTADSEYNEEFCDELCHVKSIREIDKSEESSILAEATKCRNIVEFKKRMTGGVSPISVRATSTEITINSGNSKSHYLDIVLYLNDDEGNYIGILIRKVYPTEKKVYNELFRLEEQYRNKGGGSIIYQSQEEAWKCAGYEIIEVTAGKEMGGYVWAINGYDYLGDYGRVARKRHISFIKCRLNNLKNQGVISEEIAEKLTEAADAIQYPWDVAGFEIPSRVMQGGHDKIDGRIGKLALQEIEWQGCKELAEEWHGNDVARETRHFRISVARVKSLVNLDM